MRRKLTVEELEYVESDTQTEDSDRRVTDSPTEKVLTSRPVPVPGGFAAQYVERNPATGRTTVSYWGADGFVCRNAINVGRPFQTEGEAWNSIPEEITPRSRGYRR